LKVKLINMRDKELFSEGVKRASSLNLAVYSIVRDCEKNLRKNILVIDKIRSYFNSSVVIVFENDSVDKTKEVLTAWSDRDKNVYVETQQKQGITIPSRNVGGVNKYFSEFRISKMVGFRNKYVDKLEELGFEPDFVIIVDLDVSRIYFDGVMKSFAISEYWDAVFANGTSLSPNMRRRFHDTYALVELGKEELPQTEETIRENSCKWSFLREGQPLIPVYAAFGGLAIYRYEAIRGIRYRVEMNHDKRVQVRTEHFSLCKDIRAKGFDRIYINPGLRVKCQSINLALIRKFFRNRFSP
jgi:hypothetical protein